MDSRCLARPIERLLPVFTLTAFMGIVYGKAGQVPLPRPAPLVQAL